MPENLQHNLQFKKLRITSVVAVAAVLSRLPVATLLPPALHYPNLPMLSADHAFDPSMNANSSRA
jgi:hypothetical protein